MERCKVVCFDAQVFSAAVVEKEFAVFLYVETVQLRIALNFVEGLREFFFSPAALLCRSVGSKGINQFLLLCRNIELFRYEISWTSSGTARCNTNELAPQ